MILFPFLDEIVILLDLFWCIYKENFAVVKCLLHCCNETKSKNLFGLKLRYSVHKYQYIHYVSFHVNATKIIRKTLKKMKSSFFLA